MDAEFKASLLDAVNVLSTADDAGAMYAELLELIPLAAKLDARFSGERAALNPLITLAVTNRPQYDRVIDLIASKRHGAGLSPLAPEPSYNKTDYMREFMAAKRERERRAAEIENLMRSPTEQLRGRPRLDFMQNQSARWKLQRDAALEALKRASGGNPSKADIKAALDSFWARVDRDLDELEALARAEGPGAARKIR